MRVMSQLSSRRLCILRRPKLGKERNPFENWQQHHI